MSCSNPQFFFDLSSFEHCAFLMKCEKVWETFFHLRDYIQSLSLGVCLSPISEGVILINRESILIGANTIIEPGACLEGPCVVGKECLIRRGARLRPYTLLGNRCVVGHCSEVNGSIFLDEAKAPHFNYVGDSLLGNRVNLGAGVICSNLRLDEKNVFIRLKMEKIDTGLKKLGAIIGDESSLGCHCVINPGVLLKKKSFFSPCLSIVSSHIEEVSCPLTR